MAGIYPRGPMTEQELKAAIEGEIQFSVGWLGGKVQDDREKAVDYYYAEPFGNEIAGRSQFVSSDVQDVIESLMPDFMEIFGGGEAVVEFQPTGREDEDMAKQATDYVNYIWHHDNAGFTVTHDWIKDALLQKNGIIKIYWDDTPQTRVETLTGVNLLQLQTLLEDDDVEVLEQGEREPENDEERRLTGALFDLKIKKTFTRGRIIVLAIPPDEFYISRQSVSLDDAPFKMHKTEKTVSELIEMGYPQDLIDELPSHDEEHFNEERQNRFQQEEWLDDDLRTGAMREIWVYDIYLKIDFDGDGIAEQRNIVYAGSKILHNEVVDDHPFVDMTPVRMPHVFFGRSLAELVFDIQYIKSQIIRQILDNMYLINNARSAISEKVSLDDYLTNRPGGAVRVSTQQADVGGHITQINTQPIIGHALPIVEFFDGVRETRTGRTRLNQGLDPDSLNKTASGINMLLNAGQKRTLLIARLFAEIGFKPAMQKILRLVVNNQDRARVIKLRGEWVDIDPRAWDVNMNVTPRVGLGHGTPEQRVGMLERLIAMAERIMGYQGGLGGPLITLKHVHRIIEAYINATGFKPASLFIDDPEGKQLPPPKPDPEIEKAKIVAQQKTASMQLDDQRKQKEIMLEHQRGLKELELKAREAGIELNLKQEKQNAELAMTEIEKFGQEGAQTPQILAAFAEVAQALNQAAVALQQAAQVSALPKRVVREGGKVVGVEVVPPLDAAE